MKRRELVRHLEANGCRELREGSRHTIYLNPLQKKVSAVPRHSDKIMFEVYKEATYSGKYRVVYFTELQDHNKEAEINRAMAGEHFFDGFIRAYGKDQAKETIQKLLDRLNDGEAVTKADFERELKPFTPS